jgi:RNA polymerase sigma-70 factor (ECF subfamily)
MDAEDILQESFITAFERLTELSSDGSFTSWLKRIVINKSIDQVRKNRLVFVDLSENLSDGMDDDEDANFLPEPELVHFAIRNLPGGSRTVLVLHALEGYKHRDIASMLGISESTSKTQYKRALELLNKDLKQKTYAR